MPAWLLPALLGAGAGMLLGRGGGGGGSQTTTQTQAPWGGLAPYLQGRAEVLPTYSRFGAQLTPGKPAIPGLYPEAQEWYQSASPQYYPGQAIANLSPQTLMSQDLQTMRALSGSPITDIAQRELMATLGGGYIGGNPYLDQMFGRATQNIGRQYQDIVLPQIQSSFQLGGRSGSGLESEAIGRSQRTLAETLGNVATDIYGGAYESERNRMLQSMLFAPTMAQQDYYDIGQLAGVGGEKEAYQQQLINEAINKWNFGQNLPLQKLSAYQGLLQGGPSYMSQTTTQPLYRNPMGGALGGGIAGMGAVSGLQGAGLLAAGSPYAWPIIAGSALLGGLGG